MIIYVVLNDCISWRRASTHRRLLWFNQKLY